MEQLQSKKANHETGNQYFPDPPDHDNFKQLLSARIFHLDAHSTLFLNNYIARCEVELERSIRQGEGGRPYVRKTLKKISNALCDFNIKHERHEIILIAKKIKAKIIF